ncbi:Receptor-like protein EIX2 [Linum perenne]
MAISAVFLLVWLIWVCFFCYGTHGASCNQAEREALLNFKADLQDPSSRLSSWGNGDCCKWSGVVCDNATGHVTELHLGLPFFSRNSPFKGKISPSLLGLKNLSYLDLSNNDFQGNLIPGFLGSVSSLKSLFLLRSGFGGVIPHQLGNLSNLQELSLQAGDRYVLSADSLQWLSGLSSLKYLDFEKVDLSNASDWLNMINNVPSLSELYLSNCQIRQNPPLVHVNLSSLSVLDLGYNQFVETSFPSWISHLKSLTSLDLRRNNLRGPFPNQLQNLTSLVALRLSSNKFNGSIPDWLFQFHHLEDLDVFHNELDGTVPNGIGNLTSLTILDLSFNYNLKGGGGVPVSFKSLCHLSSLNLINMKLQQNISEMLQILGECPASTLQTLYLDDCQLFGQFPDDIGKFKSLNLISLQNNSISGPLPLSFGELTSLQYVNLADNQIKGTIPASFGELTELEYVDISHNSMEGVVSFDIILTNLTKLASFYASGNQMVLEAGPDWVPPEYLEVLHLNSWYVGPGFPKWLQSFRYLGSLDMSNSGISEPIPGYISINSSFSMLDFSRNNLEGPLPAISSNLTALDLSNNFLSGNLLKFLCFNSTQMMAIEFLNLRGNLLSGEIPDCWRNWQRLNAAKTFVEYQVLVAQGKIKAYSTILNYVRSVDLSWNNLSGEIPKQITNLVALKYLNLSRNSLSGAIPGDLDAMESMESLDLSENRLFGVIPPGMSTMTFLNHLNLSYNNLSGRIPSSTQLQSFDPSSFVGNKGLCGSPLNVSCSGKNLLSSSGESSADKFVPVEGIEDSNSDWFSVSVVLGYVVGFCGIVVPVAVHQQWIKWKKKKNSITC